MTREPASPRLYTVAEMREIDRLCAEEFGLPTRILMDYAGQALAIEALEAGAGPARGVLVIAGAGANGGDGFVAARHLANAGVPVMILLIEPPRDAASDAGQNLRVARAMDLPIVRPEAHESVGEVLSRVLASLDGAPVVLDCLLGTGVSAARPVTGRYAEAIDAINRARRAGLLACVIAADVPSGLDADTGESAVAGPGAGPAEAVRADRTVTFVGLKRGMAEPSAAEFCGEITVMPVGVLAALVARFGSRAPR
jgi:ADP-dependent NAD(P)H-hydrate dehydratase / NAD(P)H-hydrate epimerase